MSTEYPVYDTYGEALIRTIGSFWYYYFGDREILTSHYRNLGHAQGQAYLDYLTAVATVGRFDIPVFKDENWYLLVLSRNASEQVKNVYGQDELVYGGSERYGDAQTNEYLFPLPDVDFFGELADIPYTLQNLVIYPSKTWTRGLDFDIDYDRKLIQFRDDPFQANVARREVYDEAGTLVDEEIAIWVYRGQFELDMIYKQWGFVVTEQLRSSQHYKDFVNAMWDSYVLGANMEAFEGAISAMVGVPVVIDANETVMDIVEEPTRTLVLTDTHVYTFEPTANITVAIGDVLNVGQAMTDSVEVIDLSGGPVDYSSVPSLSFDNSFLSGGYFSSLTFENQEVDVEYLGRDENNKAVVVFRVGGFPGDVDAFWEQAQMLGSQPGQKTLAELLDTRDNPVGEPLPRWLPATINPLEFVLENIMRNHLILIKVKVAAVPSDSPGLKLFRYLRDVIPPHTTYIVFVEVSPTADTIDLSQAGDTEEAGVEEEVAPLGVATPDNEVLYPSSEAPVGAAAYEDVVVRVYKVSEVCE